MPQEYSEDRIVFKLTADEDFELDKLGEAFAGLAREYQAHLVKSGVALTEQPAKLFVTDLKKSSVEFEVATIVATGATLYGAAYAGVDFVVTWTDFYEKIKRGLGYLAGREARPADFDQNDARNLDSFLGALKGKRNGHATIKRAKFVQKTGDRTIVADFEFDEKDVATAEFRLAQELSALPPEIAKPTANQRRQSNLAFRWHRTDLEKGKAAGQTSDRGVIATINDKPLPVFFASEIENYKDMMVKQLHNPFGLTYFVDAMITYNDKMEPQSYTLLNILSILGPDGKQVWP